MLLSGFRVILETEFDTLDCGLDSIPHPEAGLLHLLNSSLNHAEANLQEAGEFLMDNPTKKAEKKYLKAAEMWVLTNLIFSHERFLVSVGYQKAANEKAQEALLNHFLHLAIKAAYYSQPFLSNSEYAEGVRHKDWVVRYAVAQNSHAGEFVHSTLSTDSDWRVRYGVAINDKTDYETLNSLALDENLDVKKAAYRSLMTYSASVISTKRNVYALRKKLRENEPNY